MGRTRRLGISMTPMIDVVFLLLLFFLLTTQLQSSNAVPLRAATAGASSNAAPELIEIGDGLTRNGQPINASDWRIFLAENDPRPLAIRPSAGVSVSELLALVDQAREAGWSEITLVESGS